MKIKAYPGDVFQLICSEDIVGFGGTSAAAPFVSGITALMLEANPNLTARDIQHIFVKTAQPIDTSHSDWVANEERYGVNHQYGFGAIDPVAAVEAAANWVSVHTEFDPTICVSSVYDNITIERVEVVFDADDSTVKPIFLEVTESILLKTLPNDSNGMVTGTQVMENDIDNLQIDNSDDHIIGGTTPEAGNLISGNYHGIYIKGSNTMGSKIIGNYIGTDVTDTQNLGNSIDGIQIHHAVNIIGGTESSRNMGQLEEPNRGEYQGVKEFQLEPGGEYLIMLVPNGTVQEVFDNLENVWGTNKQPLYSMTSANPNEALHVGQIADMTGDGHTFVMEDFRGAGDRDYNDLIFRVQAAIVRTVHIELWHLEDSDAESNEVGANVSSIWELVTGSGVTIAVVDDGVQSEHPDMVDFNSDFSEEFNTKPLGIEDPTLSEASRQERWEIAQGFFLREAEVLEPLGKKHDRIPQLLAYFEEDQPDNIIRRQQDNALVLVDFGAVKQVCGQMVSHSGEVSLTVIIGTKGYRAMEQAAGRPRFDSDLYALGMIAVEALTRINALQLETDHRDADSDEINWQHLARGASPGLKEFLNRQDWRDRYQSAKEALIALNSLEFDSHELPTIVPRAKASLVPTTPAATPATIPAAPAAIPAAPRLIFAMQRRQIYQILMVKRRLAIASYLPCD
ncbi:MAG: DUF4114 domain-containing protein [Oscillatoria sp. SIO1A7]|nr:DUF4114 domain-containing protein [Oscillatoria sp. SIO1A7]